PALLAVTLLTGGCASVQDQDQTLAARDLYSQIKANIAAGNYKTAIQRLTTLESRFPFNDFGTQAQLDLIYVNYLDKDYDTAEDAADRFIREHPRHPDVDYAYYMKGVAYFDEAPGLLESLFGKDTFQRDPANARKSFQAFQLFLQKFPDSRYTMDARQRMVFLRDRLARYEWAVADYYMRRGAWISALQRAYAIVNQYPQTPSTKDALQIMCTAYARLGLTQLAADSRRVLAMNFPDASPDYTPHGPS
ncbi:MAG TPA: outer membrane protein assembly factor BamD, partial [Gammaproteobacteria bacterium]|nr:outer membrane protein assembly factor BamD [Gammaproteobacteria bacterium]